MPVVSIRFSDDPIHQRLKNSARDHDVAISALAERLIDEGLRMEAHPMVTFRDGPGGRRPALVGGPEVVDVIGAIVGGNVPVAERRARAAEIMNVSETLIDAALAYYEAHTEEIDTDLARRSTRAIELEKSWRRQQALLEK